MKSQLLIIGILCFWGLSLEAQTTGSRHSFKPNEKVYIILPDTTSVKAKSYMKVFNENWKFCKFEFILPSQKEALIAPGNYFFGLTAIKRKDFNSRNGRMELIILQVNLELFEFKKEKSGKKEINVESYIVSFKLPIQDRNYFDKLLPGNFFYGGFSALDTSMFDLDKRLFMVGPGLMKNYIQRMELTLKGKVPNEDSKKDLSIVDDAKSLSKLKDMTLYIPEHCLLDYSLVTNTYKEELKNEAKLFEKYTYAYEVISDAELNKKILDSGDEFFYLYYVNDSPRKYINIISSKTGKVVYADFSTPSYDFTKKDLKSLMSAINSQD